MQKWGYSFLNTTTAAPGGANIWGFTEDVTAAQSSICGWCLASTTAGLAAPLRCSLIQQEAGGWVEYFHMDTLPYRIHGVQVTCQHVVHASTCTCLAGCHTLLCRLCVVLQVVWGAGTGQLPDPPEGVACRIVSLDQVWGVGGRGEQGGCHALSVVIVQLQVGIEQCIVIRVAFQPLAGILFK